VAYDASFVNCWLLRGSKVRVDGHHRMGALNFWRLSGALGSWWVDCRVIERPGLERASSGVVVGGESWRCVRGQYDDVDLPVLIGVVGLKRFLKIWRQVGIEVLDRSS